PCSLLAVFEPFAISPVVVVVVTSMRLSLRIGFGHLTWIKFKAATYGLPCWIVRDGPRYCRCRPVERHAEAVDASTSNKESRHGYTSHPHIWGSVFKRRDNKKMSGKRAFDE